MNSGDDGTSLEAVRNTRELGNPRTRQSAVAAGGAHEIASNWHSTMQRKLFGLRPREWPHATKIISSTVAPGLIVLAQNLIARDFPIHFAPSLLVVSFVGWFFGSSFGALATASAALSVNFFLLKPRYSWSVSATEVLATCSFVVLAVFGLIAIASLRGVLERLERALRDAGKIARVESERRQVAEKSLAQKLESFESEISRLRGYVESYERAKRFAKVAQVRLAELQTAIEEFPLPIALIGDEHGLPVIRFASKGFRALACSSESMATIDMFASILTPNLRSYPEERHPLVRALRGETIVHEAATWCATHVPQPVHLYIQPIVDQRFIAVAVIAGQRPLSGLVN